MKHVNNFYTVDIFKKGLYRSKMQIVLGLTDGTGRNTYCVIPALRNVILDPDLVGKFHVQCK